MHQLQQMFAAAEGEQVFEARLRALFAAGDLDGAEAVLTAELAGLDTEIGALCRNLARGAVVLSGWEDLVDAIRMHEGEPVSGVTLAIANELDLAFEKGRLHDPYVMLGLYTDEAFAFSAAAPAALLAECEAEQGPAWAGRDEDIELYLAIEGLAPLNTALLFHKQRHFFRDEAAPQAPLRYVEYVVGCWWRALRYQQAVAAEYARHGLPGAIPVVAGMVEMRPELVAVHRAVDCAVHWAGTRAAAPAEPRVETLEMANIAPADFIQRKPAEEVREVTGADLRRRVATSEPEDAPAEKKGLLARLLDWGRARREAT